MRICPAAAPRSTLRINAPSRSLSPSRRLPSFRTSAVKGSLPSGSGTALNIGASSQNGDAEPSSLSGSSQASRPHDPALRSASVCLLMGKGAPPGGGMPAAAIHQSTI